eukprot:GHRR01030050.1.p1 GENE.GHRR01030050.1~~GHRR01030050.1.p1  ORF type:complete len:279 (+),score=71.66 GHRR01030050.1:289-1125(+)
MTVSVKGRYDENASDAIEEAEERIAPVRPQRNRNKPNSSITGKQYYECANERLYEAYSELHLLAQGVLHAVRCCNHPTALAITSSSYPLSARLSQLIGANAADFEKPFDSPAILVVGHQTDGKSALVEALMGEGKHQQTAAVLTAALQWETQGAVCIIVCASTVMMPSVFAGFQFNHVGGGTKTRRPITLHMKYNSAAVQPTCYLLTEDSGEQQVTLEELQEYIHQENQRLEDEQQFWSKEIVVRIEYKYCPNLTIIDTPGAMLAGAMDSQLCVTAGL